METTWLQRGRMIVAVGLLGVLSACAGPGARTAQLDLVTTTQHAPAAAPSTAPANFVNVHALIIVRHADVNLRQKGTLGNATPLLDRGEERAKELAYALKDSGVTRIVTSEALRTQETAAVLAKNLKIKPEIPFEQGAFMLGDPKKLEHSTVIGYLAQTGKPDDVVLVVHHHSVIPSMLAELGFKNDPRIDENEYDRIYVILPDAANHTYRMLRLRYGGTWKTEP